MDSAANEFIRIQSALAGRYSLERELGRGGMGIVFLARDVALDRLVALKLLPPNLSNEPTLRQRFLNEARTAAKLSHPNIIPIFAVEEIGDYVFFVMAFVDGETLGQRVRTRGALTPSELAKILREVAWGLAYAHGQGVIHRDVKADNILLERASGRALVADFGIARVTQRDGATGAGEILGTAEYMSPEQASGEVIDPRSDIYSLGVVAFYALSGRLPFEGGSVQSILSKHITQPAPLVRDVCDGVPSRLARAVDKCLAKSPDDRFHKAEDVADAASAMLEARRELPPPVRVFIKRSRDLSQVAAGVGFFQLMLTTEAVALTALGAPPGVFTLFMLSAAVLGTIPIGPATSQARTLIKSGFTRADVNASWRAELEREREERAFEHGRRAGSVERIARTIALGSLGGAVAYGFQVPFNENALVALIAFSSAVASGGLLTLVRYDRRTDLGGRFMSWFWKSKLGKWTFDLARIGLKRSAIAAPATHRPTELAIGMAVDALFESLPKDARQRLADLPGVVRGLEANALRIRERVNDLNDAVAQAEAGKRLERSRAPNPVTAAKRDALERDLYTVRDAAKARMADAVTALEGIRLNLLRMTAGAGSVDSLTADLTAAKRVSEDVTRLLAGYEEVERSLKGPE